MASDRDHTRTTRDAGSYAHSYVRAQAHTLPHPDSTGRLCGYRSQTIGSLLAGKEDSELAVSQALAHLHHCHTRQIRHNTDAPNLRAAFDARALSVLPLPAYTASHASLLDQLQTTASRVARFFQRISTSQAGGVRERALEVVSGTSASAKLAAGIASVLLLAGGAVDATTSTHPARRHPSPQRPVAVHTHVIPPRASVAHTVPRKPSGQRRSSHRLPRPSEQHTAGGFSYLGSSPTSRPASPSTNAPVVKQQGGTPFEP